MDFTQYKLAAEARGFNLVAFGAGVYTKTFDVFLKKRHVGVVFFKIKSLEFYAQHKENQTYNNPNIATLFDSIPKTRGSLVRNCIRCGKFIKREIGYRTTVCNKCRISEDCYE